MERISFTRQELYNLVWEEPMLSLAKKYDITDVGLRKVCLRMDIPVPPVGYWQKRQFGKEVKKVKLPSSYDGERQYTLRTRDPEDKFRHGEPSPMRTRQREIESDMADELAAPERLSNPFKLITEVREYLKTPGAKSYRYEGVVESGSNKLNIRVAPTNVGRALRFMNTLIKLLQLRGHGVEVSTNKSYALIYGQKLEISFKERLKKVVIPDTYRDRTEFHPTGLLYFKMDGYHGKEWSDSKVKLEGQLSNILAKLEISAEAQNVRKAKWAKESEVRKANEQQEKERWERKNAELTAFKNLLVESERWQKLKIMRAYIHDVEMMTKDKVGELTDIREWIIWAKNKVNWYDPYLNQKDELLEDVDKNTLEFKKQPSFTI